MPTMAAFSTRLRYGAVAQFFHWATAILVVAAFVYGPGGSERRGPFLRSGFCRTNPLTLGARVGCVVSGSMCLRVVSKGPPGTPPSPPKSPHTPASDIH